MLKNLTDFRKTAEAGVDPLLSQKSMLNEVVSICKLLLVNLATSPRRGGWGGILVGDVRSGSPDDPIPISRRAKKLF